MKTMPKMLAVFFAMLICAVLATGQTVNPETDEVTEQQPSWCNSKCISMPVKTQGEGAMQVVEDASRRDAVVINNFNFTKMRSLQGDEFSVNTVIHVGDVWFMTVEDAFSPPDWPKVKEILQAEQKRMSSSGVSVNTKPNLASANSLNNSAPAAKLGVETPPASNPAPVESGSAPQGAAKEGIKNTDGKEFVFLNCGDKRFVAVCVQYFKIAYGLEAGQADRPSAQDHAAFIRDVILKVIFISALSILLNIIVTFHTTLKAIICKLYAFWRARRSARASAVLKLLDSASVLPAPSKLMVMPTPTAQSLPLSDSGVKVTVQQPQRSFQPKPYIPLRGMVPETMACKLPPQFNTPKVILSEKCNWGLLESLLDKRIRKIPGMDSDSFWIETELTFVPQDQDKSDRACLVSFSLRFQDPVPKCIGKFLNDLGHELAYVYLGHGKSGNGVYRVGPRYITSEWPTASTTATQEPATAAAVL